MANKKISQLPVAPTPLTATDLVPVVHAGVTDKTTVQDIANLAKVNAGQIAYGAPTTGLITSDASFTHTNGVHPNGGGTTIAHSHLSGGFQENYSLAINSAGSQNHIQRLDTGAYTNNNLTSGAYLLECQNGLGGSAGIYVEAPNIFQITNNSITWNFPTADGTSGQVLSTNGSGTLGWSSLPSSGHFSTNRQNLSGLTSVSDIIDAMWTRIGNVVTVQYSMTIVATGSVPYSFSVNIPFAIDGLNLAGSGSSEDNFSSISVQYTSGEVYVFGKATGVTPSIINFSLTYRAL